MRKREQVLVEIARREDGEAILSMLQQLAAWEGAPHSPRLCQSTLERDVFGADPKLRILVARNQFRKVVGFISYHENYSSWEGAAGIHIGDLWVSPAYRSQGVGSALLKYVAGPNQNRRVDVFVTRDNNARFFYERLGFEEQAQWTLYRREPGRS